MDAFNVIYRCLQKSFCNDWLNSKLKGSLTKLGVFKVSRGHPPKVVKLPIIATGAENMEYLIYRDCVMNGIFSGKLASRDLGITG